MKCKFDDSSFVDKLFFILLNMFLVEILWFVFEFGLFFFDDYKMVLLVCKFFYIILRLYIFCILVLGVDEEKFGCEWMVDFVGKNK